MRLLLAVAAILAALSAPAYAACGAGGIQPCTVGVGAGTVLNAYSGGGTGYKQIAVDNESATASIAVCWGAGCTPALNTAGSFTLPPGTTRSWAIPYGSEGGFNDPISAIASGAATPVTVQAQ